MSNFVIISKKKKLEVECLSQSFNKVFGHLKVTDFRWKFPKYYLPSNFYKRKDFSGPTLVPKR